MKPLGKEKTYTDFCDKFFDPFRRDLQIDTTEFEYVGTSTLARRGTIAVLGNDQPGTRSNKRRGCRNVEGVQRIAAGSHDIYYRRTDDLNPPSVPPHSPGGTDEFADRFSFHCQCNEKPGKQNRLLVG
jgi:hypothetical protein